ncbi:hypothetical protein EMA8858_02293 [Emticicia aquatica]|jgi:hypothetical protein|uniref:Uncharacterized protein n=1 Tax=Emticicia aquatica TaxID=1681835 RepID=A0ABM9AR20_9BACT|nr:hypothetical protein EMA8858_02293 [Emticicia aquatica]
MLSGNTFNGLTYPFNYFLLNSATKLHQDFEMSIFIYREDISLHYS